MTEAKPRKKRHFLAIELRLDHYAQAKASAAEIDISVTAWVRQLVLAELQRNPPKQDDPSTPKD